MNVLILKLNATGDVVRTTTTLLHRLQGDITWIAAPFAAALNGLFSCLVIDPARRRAILVTTATQSSAFTSLRLQVHSSSRVKPRRCLLRFPKRGASHQAAWSNG